MESGTCESCGSDSDDLSTVQRIYLTRNEAGLVDGETLADLERWCLACQSLYPHARLNG